MKKSVTFRFDEMLMDEVRECARSDNRTVTNFIETLLKQHLIAGRSTRRATRRNPANAEDAVMQSPPLAASEPRDAG